MAVRTSSRLARDTLVISAPKVVRMRRRKSLTSHTSTVRPSATAPRSAPSMSVAAATALRSGTAARLPAPPQAAPAEPDFPPVLLARVAVRVCPRVQHERHGGVGGSPQHVGG